MIARAEDAFTPLTGTAPALRHAPLDVVDGPAVLDLVQSGSRSELRVVGPGAPSEPLTLGSRRARDPGHDRARRHGISTSPTAYGARRLDARDRFRARRRARWSRRRLRVQGRASTAPPPSRALGLRTLVATSQRVRRRHRIFLTTAGPAGHVHRTGSRKPGGSDLAPLAATGPDGRVYVAWTHRPGGRARSRRGVAPSALRRVRLKPVVAFGPYVRTPP